MPTRNLGATTDLHRITPVGFEARLLGDPPEAGVEMKLELEMDVGFQRNTPTQFALRALLRAQLRLPDQKPFFAASYDVGALYSLRLGDETDEEVKAFCETNGLIHVWPYFRMFVQTSAAQLGLVNVTIPVFRVGGPADQLKVEKAKKA